MYVAVGIIYMLAPYYLLRYFVPSGVYDFGTNEIGCVRNNTSVFRVGKDTFS